MRDLYNNITARIAVTPIAVADNTAQVGSIIDVSGYQSCTFVIATGTLADADATFTVLVEEGDVANLSDAAAVADADLLGTESVAGFNFGDDGETRKIGYRGSKRYVRMTITPAANASSAPLAAVAIMGHPRSAPAS